MTKLSEKKKVRVKELAADSFIEDEASESSLDEKETKEEKELDI